MKIFDSLWLHLLEEKQEIAMSINNATTLDQLSDGDTVIQVHYSGINYKDALATKYHSGVIQNYPIIPGIDLAGVVLEAPSDAPFKKGDSVLVTGYGTGVSHTGGFSEIARVPHEWVIPLPTHLSLKEAMTYGTAGFTAALAIQQLENNGMLLTNQPRLLITGASGGVGSLAIAILHQLGYQHITAVSRKPSMKKFLENIGAENILSPDDLLTDKKRPLEKQTIDFAIDTVGGDLLSALLPHISYQGAVSLCGNAGGIKFGTTVLPFILRGVRLIGIDSVQASNELRTHIWERLANEMKPNHFDSFVTNEIALSDIPACCQTLLAGTHHGRTIVNIKNH